jgi:Lsr2
MARETFTRLLDDLDGGEAEETVKFALDGRSYEIDLAAKNAAKLRSTLATYIAKGSKLGRASAGGRTRATSSREDNQAIRVWAEEQGYEVASRGRISQEIVELYMQAEA